MSSNINVLKVGDLIRIREDLPIENDSFRESSPGWFPEMDKIIGTWGEIETIEDKYITVKFDNGDNWYIIEEYIDFNANPIYRNGKMKTPKKGDWVIYFESEDDRSIATLGKVTNHVEGTYEWEVDRIPGFQNVYPFNGDVKVIDKIRSGELF